MLRGTLLLGACLALTGCWNRLDTIAVEQEIEAEIESQSRRLSLAEVRCPANITKQSGAYFRCVGYLRPEGEFTINVVQQDAQGGIAWDVPSSSVILNMAKVEDKLQQDFAQAFAKRATVDCGDLYRLNLPGEEFACDVVGGVVVGTEQVTALVVKVDPEGNLTWYENREAIAPAANVSDPSGESDADATSDTQSSSGASSTSSPSSADTTSQG